MHTFDDWTAANMEVVLENICRSLPNGGGNHDSRKFIAKKLMRAAQRGDKTLGALETAARRAFEELPHR
jgi:uncharacterized protein YbaP (TraB family)